MTLFSHDLDEEPETPDVGRGRWIIAMDYTYKTSGEDQTIYSDSRPLPGHEGVTWSHRKGSAVVYDDPIVAGAHLSRIYADYLDPRGKFASGHYRNARLIRVG